MDRLPDRETVVAALLRHFGEGPVSVGRLGFIYDGAGPYPILNIDQEAMTYGVKSWKLPITDHRFLITGVETKRSLKGVGCVVYIGLIRDANDRSFN